MSNEGIEQTAASKRVYKPRKRKPILGLVPRVLIVILMVGVTGAACAGIGAKIAQPMLLDRQYSSQVQAAREARAQTDADNRKLDGQYEYLKSPGGMELTARQQGYVKHGEVSVVIENVPAPPSDNSRSMGIVEQIKSAWAKITGL